MNGISIVCEWTVFFFSSAAEERSGKDHCLNPVCRSLIQMHMNPASFSAPCSDSVPLHSHCVVHFLQICPVNNKESLLSPFTAHRVCLLTMIKMCRGGEHDVFQSIHSSYSSPPAYRMQRVYHRDFHNHRTARRKGHSPCIEVPCVYKVFHLYSLYMLQTYIQRGAVFNRHLLGPLHQYGPFPAFFNKAVEGPRTMLYSVHIIGLTYIFSVRFEYQTSLFR